MARPLGEDPQSDYGVNALTWRYAITDLQRCLDAHRSDHWRVRKSLPMKQRLACRCRLVTARLALCGMRVVQNMGEAQ